MKEDRKTIGFVVIIAVIGIGAIAAVMYTHPFGAPEEKINWNLTLIGTAEKVVTFDELRAMPSYEGYGGFFSTVGMINGPFKCKGVPVEDLCALVGGINDSISLDYNITVNQLYTYPCTGTGGHTAFARIWNETTGVCAEAHWEGYVDDYHNISFNRTLDLKKGVVYQYTIITGSYPQIIHATSFNTAAGTIRCTEFVDANEKVSYNVIPAITLWQK